ncbi:MAG: HEPN domain-containing protein [Deltaproteobacteria bacterium]|nr:HEPN domain-containing protein [Deltaproteobacteria bacterium]
MGTIEQQFEECLRKGGIKVFRDATKLTEKELTIAASDLAEAKDGLQHQRWKWSTIQAYYSMFHAARALLYAKGYREKSHHCLRIGIAHLYYDAGKNFEDLIDIFQLAKRMRENADYADDFSENNSKKITQAADAFLGFAKKIIAP